MRRTNYGFRRVEMLNANIAVIEINRFEELAYSQSAAGAALAFAASADAVIFDVRSNPGGVGDILNFVVSHFIPAGTELMATFDRETGKTLRARTRRVPGKRMAVPLFVVIGPGTASAAEAFAFTLQQTGRATIVGERSQGAAQGGGWVPAGGGFIVFIPSFRPFNPRTGKSWQGTGVLPDVAAPNDRALAVAHLRAVQALEAKAPRADYRWLLPILELQAGTPAAIDVDGLAGRYQGIEISLAGGALKFLGASGILRDLTPLPDGTFLIEDAEVPPHLRARVRFIRDASAAVTRLELLTDSGRVLPRPRL